VATLKNQLYYGDNLEVLKRYVKDESVDLVYLDPPFNSRQDYNVLFAKKDGSQSSSQIRAFEDTWEWNIDAQRAYEQIVGQGGRVADVDSPLIPLAVLWTRCSRYGVLESQT